jgi:restriction endonuclease S subunit
MTDKQMHKYVPQLRFPEFADSGEWEVKRLGDFADLYAGATPSTSNVAYWDNGTIPWMSSGEVHNGQIFQTEKKITTLGYDSCSTKLVPVNSVVVALAGQGKTRGLQMFQHSINIQIIHQEYLILLSSYIFIF